ncbi:DUF4817 domain-containing protein [Trichonephila clavipes]|nr:DUF4817 domain-containing protein [Trichonephila clavipes]
MSTNEQKAFCVLQFAKTESAINGQRAFRTKFGCQPPDDNNIRSWYHQFVTTGCLCKGKSTGRPSLVPARISSQSSHHCWRSPHASALIQRDFGCVLRVQQTKHIPLFANVDLVWQLGGVIWVNR